MTKTTNAALVAALLLGTALAAPAHAQGFFDSIGQQLGQAGRQIGAQLGVSSPNPRLRNDSSGALQASLSQHGVPWQGGAAAVDGLGRALASGQQQTAHAGGIAYLALPTGAAGQNCRTAQLMLRREEVQQTEVTAQGTWCYDTAAGGWVTQGGGVGGSMLAALPRTAEPQQAQARAPMQAEPPRPVVIAQQMDETRTMRLTTPLRAEPSSSARSLGNLIRGTTVELTGTVAGGPWVRIGTNGKVGYALASSLNPAETAPPVQQTQAMAPSAPPHQPAVVIGANAPPDLAAAREAAQMDTARLAAKASIPASPPPAPISPSQTPAPVAPVVAKVAPVPPPALVAPAQPVQATAPAAPPPAPPAPAKPKVDSDL